jgi:putative addiction module killer protein
MVADVFEVRQTPVFKAWLENLPDRRAVVRIAQRLVRLESGLLGDVKPIGRGVSELRIDHGPGYRVYFTLRGKIVIVLLCGGNKRTQTRDIKTAWSLAGNIKGEHDGDRNAAF